MEIFGNVLDTDALLREHYREPSPLVKHKKFAELDQHFTAFIGVSPFCLVATVDEMGNSDVSPRGGPPGFVRMLDDRHLLLPDLSGNNLLDSMTNVVATQSIGLLFVVPGEDETVRINGRACVTIDDGLLGSWDGEIRRPKAAIGVEIDEVFHHCAKAFRRGGIWSPETWPNSDDVPDFCNTYAEKFGFMPADEMRVALEEGYAVDLAGERPDT